jgi:hypothetical protein
VVRGVGSVVCLTPFLVTFYAIFALLEDVGYLARIAYVMHGPMTRIGLTGKAFVALLFSLPCNVAGVSAGRICDSDRQRKMAAILAPFVPCSAKLAVSATLASWLFPPWIAGAAVFGVLVLNALLLGLAGTTVDRLLPGREAQHLLLELPRYQRPRLRVIASEAVARGWAFVQKAGTLIVSFCVLVWFFAYYPTGDIRTSLLGQVGVRLEPLGAVLGFDWRLLTSLLTSVLNKEAVLATLAIIYGVPLDRLPEVLRAEMGAAQAMSFMVAQSLFLPCVATMGVLRKECGRSWVVLAVAGERPWRRLWRPLPCTSGCCAYCNGSLPQGAFQCQGRFPQRRSHGNRPSAAMSRRGTEGLLRLGLLLVRAFLGQFHVFCVHRRVAACHAALANGLGHLQGRAADVSGGKHARNARGLPLVRVDVLHAFVQGQPQGGSEFKHALGAKFYEDA